MVIFPGKTKNLATDNPCSILATANHNWARAAGTFPTEHHSRRYQTAQLSLCYLVLFGAPAPLRRQKTGHGHRILQSEIMHCLQKWRKFPLFKWNSRYLFFQWLDQPSSDFNLRFLVSKLIGLKKTFKSFLLHPTSLHLYIFHMYYKVLFWIYSDKIKIVTSIF